MRRKQVFLAAAGAVLGVVMILSAYVASALQNLPEVNSAPIPAGSIVVFDRYGQVLSEHNALGAYHVITKLGEVGQNNIRATLAAEDRDFYRHGALNLAAAFRAAVVDLISNRPAEGGSTITQQLVKLQLLTPSKSIARKVQEAVLASQLENTFTKDQILERYLNSVYYGAGAYGLGSAAKTYFGADKKATDLTVAQAAFLAGLLQAPSADDPRTNWPGARGRELYVLDQMASAGFISHTDAATAALEDVQAELKYDTSYRVTHAPNFVDYAVQRLSQTIGKDAAKTGGYGVYTTLDSGLQYQAEKSVSAGVGALADRGVNNGMLLAANTITGEILAWVGSANYGDKAIGGQFDVVESPRQPGSSFKPYVYVSALHDKRITLASCVQDVPKDFNGYRPLDFDNSYMGTMSARKALLLSRNIPAVEVADKEGIDHVISMADSLGITNKLQPYLSTAIGASEVTMYNHVQGYQTIANEGHKVPLVSITRIIDAGGKTLYHTDPTKPHGDTQPISRSDAYLITDVLKDYQNQWDLGFNRQMASKSGTSGGKDLGVHNDAWMMAYNHYITIGAWAGNTSAGGGGSPISAFGTETGQQMLAPFINILPAQWSIWYQQPPELASGRNGELFLPGTENSNDSLCTGHDNGNFDVNKFLQQFFQHGHDHGGGGGHP